MITYTTLKARIWKLSLSFQKQLQYDPQGLRRGSEAFLWIKILDRLIFEVFRLLQANA